MATLSEIRKQTRNIIADSFFLDDQDGAVRRPSWPDSVVNDAINFAISEYCKLTMSTYKETALSGGPTDSLFQYSVPANCLKVVRVFASDGKQLYNTAIGNVAHRNPFWKSLQVAGSSPESWTMYDGNKVMLIPGNISASSYPTVGFIEKPVSLALDSDTPDARIATAYHDYMKYMAGSLLLESLSDTTLMPIADRLKNQFYMLIGVNNESWATEKVMPQAIAGQPRT